MEQSFALDSREGAARVILPINGISRDPGSRFREVAVASLATASISGRFCAWRGASSRRYIASVYPVDPSAEDAGLPEFEAFVVISVARTGTGRRILDVAAVERASDLKFARRAALSGRADEWHVHLLADDRAARAAMVADLHARHGNDAIAARCA